MHDVSLAARTAVDLQTWWSQYFAHYFNACGGLLISFISSGDPAYTHRLACLCHAV